MTDSTNAPPSLSERYRTLDKVHGASLVSRALACVSDLRNEDLLPPERRYQLVVAFIQSYQRERERII